MKCPFDDEEQPVEGCAISPSGLVSADFCSRCGQSEQLEGLEKPQVVFMGKSPDGLGETLFKPGSALWISYG